VPQRPRRITGDEGRADTEGNSEIPKQGMHPSKILLQVPLVKNIFSDKSQQTQLKTQARGCVDKFTSIFKQMLQLFARAREVRKRGRGENEVLF